MAQSQSRPLWRMAFDSADRLIGPASEQLVRTEAFADLIGLASRMRYVALKRTERALRQQWHVWNLPASTDVRRLSEQVASLERQVRNLARELEDSRRPARPGAIDAPRADTDVASTNGGPALAARTEDKTPGRRRA